MSEKFEGKLNIATHSDTVIEQSMRSGMNVAAGIDNMRQQYMDRANRRIEMYRDNEQQYLDGMLKEIDERTEDQIVRLKAVFNENSDKWINDIFSSIISGN